MDIWHNLEIGIILIVIGFQLFHTLKTYSSISNFKSIFQYPLTQRQSFVEKSKMKMEKWNSWAIVSENSDSEEELVELALLDTKGKNEVIVKINAAVNTYLVNNHGANVNFSIIKDIIDREIEVNDESISQSVNVPLYLGLSATMVGIIFGLFAMPDLNNDGFSDGISALITGVKIAMLGSLVGLVCTIFLSSFALKSARSKVLQEKNEQLTYLQAKLLPELIRAEDTGVSGLKSSLDKFARVATNISESVLTAANKTGENLEMQQEVMERVENMKVYKVSKWNTELFERMEKNMDALQSFSAYISGIDRISHQLSDFSKRTADVDKIISGIEATLDESRSLTQLLTAQYSRIQGSGDAALKSVGIAEEHFEKAIQMLNKRTEEMVQNLFKSAGDHELKLEGIYSSFGDKLEKTSQEYVDAFNASFGNAVPKLNHLEELKEIPRQLERNNRLLEGVLERMEIRTKESKVIMQASGDQTKVNDFESIKPKKKKKRSISFPVRRSLTSDRVNIFREVFKSIRRKR